MAKKEWNPDDPVLKSVHAPYETGAVMRMYRAGWPSGAIMRELGMTASKVMKVMTTDVDKETLARRLGRDVHAPRMKGTEE